MCPAGKASIETMQRGGLVQVIAPGTGGINHDLRADLTGLAVHKITDPDSTYFVIRDLVALHLRVIECNRATGACAFNDAKGHAFRTVDLGLVEDPPTRNRLIMDQALILNGLTTDPSVRGYPGCGISQGCMGTERQDSVCQHAAVQKGAPLTDSAVGRYDKRDMLHQVGC